MHDFYILYEVWAGGAAKLAASAGAVQSAHQTLVKFVFIGWAIYPIGSGRYWGMVLRYLRRSSYGCDLQYW